jgi:phosphoribosylformimino-5-aminoimidazole carboxamide ribotide isomerase
MIADSGFNLVPVIDLKHGRAVHAVAGRRDAYQTARGVLGDGDDPVALALAMAKACQTNRLYVADLDAIAGLTPQRALVDSLALAGLELWLDAGVTEPADAWPWLEADDTLTVVLGLETIRGPRALAEAARRDPSRFAFSLDLVAGEPRRAPGWETGGMAELFGAATDAGIRRMLAIDLARVGTGDGPWGQGVVEAWRRAGATGELLAGGGVRGPDDLMTLAQTGFHGALVATALHRGMLQERLFGV